MACRMSGRALAKKSIRKPEILRRHSDKILGQDGCFVGHAGQTIQAQGEYLAVCIGDARCRVRPFRPP